jgi:glycosyltransferase involved in cell wall biosynthesis
MNCYNSDKYLKEAIDSIYAQTCDNWEIIFWDNCSSDRSSSIAKSYDGKLKYFLAKQTTSLGKARNFALREAKGDYVAFLDCDDAYLPDKIEIQLAAMKKNNAALSFGGWIKINEKGEKLSEYKMKSNFGYEFETLLSKYNVNWQTVMFDNSFLKKNNISFDENLSFSPDFNLVLRIAYNSPVLAIDELLAKYRVHDNSMSSHSKVEKINDFNYTINFFKDLGVEEKYKNFKYVALRAKYHMFLFDSFEERNYGAIIGLILKYLLSLIKEFFDRFKHG